MKISLSYAFISSEQKTLSCRSGPWKSTICKNSLCACKVSCTPKPWRGWERNLTEYLLHAKTVPGSGNITVSKTSPCWWFHGLHGIAGEADDQITGKKDEVIAVIEQGRKGIWKNERETWLPLRNQGSFPEEEKFDLRERWKFRKWALQVAEQHVQSPCIKEAG